MVLAAHVAAYTFPQSRRPQHRELRRGTPMLNVTVEGDRVRIGERFAVSFHRTLRIPDDGRPYPLPPGLGRFPIERVANFPGGVPEAWRDHNGVFIPLYQREALWIGFEAAAWKPNAVKIGVGGVNAVTGAAWDDRLRARPQDYLVSPPQAWLDGVISGDGSVHQFVAMPLGMGYTLEAQVTGAESVGGIQILVFEPRPGRFPDQPPEQPPGPPAALRAPEMGLGAGGQIRQKVYADPHGVEAWDADNRGRLNVHLVNSDQYRELTGKLPPPSPVDAKAYVEHGLPWFDLYDEGLPHLPPAAPLIGVKTIREHDTLLGIEPGSEEQSYDVSERQIHRQQLDQTQSKSDE